jgi:hypothetical protein
MGIPVSEFDPRYRKSPGPGLWIALLIENSLADE